MITPEEQVIFKDALHVYGRRSQITMAFEEMAELQKELCKYLRAEDNVPHIAEEIADVEIMLDQMRLYFGFGDRVDEIRAEKVKRLRDRMREMNARPKCTAVLSFPFGDL